MQRTKSPERQSVKAPEKTAHEKIISAPGWPEWPLHEKYDLDEVVTDKLSDGPQYIIIRAYRQQREGEEFNVDLPAYFCRFLNDAKYYFFKGPTSKYFHEANYADIEGRFKRGKAVSNRILWYDDLSNASVLVWARKRPEEDTSPSRLQPDPLYNSLALFRAEWHDLGKCEITFCIGNTHVLKPFSFDHTF